MRAPLTGRNLSLRLPTLLLATAMTSRSSAMSTATAATASPAATAATATAATSVVAFEGRPAAASSLTSKEFLLAYPAGAYTTARTCGGGTRVFEWNAHVDRTAASLRSMMERRRRDDAVPPPTSCRLADPSELRRRLGASVAEAVRAHREADGVGGDGSGELKITALVGWGTATTTDGSDGDGDEGWAACHVTRLPPLPSPPVRVEVRGSPRSNAAAKDSSWVSDRAPLEALMSASDVGGPVNELLLANDDGAMLEGSQTNFYAVAADGTVRTAGEGILAGTVRGLVLDACRRAGIPVDLRPPDLREAGSWEGALISSTSRLALPVDELYVPGEGRPSGRADLRRAFGNGPDSVAMRIRALVAAEVEARSTPVDDLATVIGLRL